METIKVHVLLRKDRPCYYMRYADPISNRQQWRSTETNNKREAEKMAAKWEAELQEGRYTAASRIGWADFRERYDEEKLASLAEATASAADTAFNHLERIIGPRKLGALTPEVLSRFQRELRRRGLREASIAGHLRHLRAALGWAVRQGMLAKVPDIERPHRARKQAKAMRGRPITAEEFERMLAAVPVVRKREPEKWVRLLLGLWLSGLRLGEALALSWDEDAALTVRLDGRYPKLRIWAEGHKGHRDELLPITPDFAEMLHAVPAEERAGLVFDIITSIKRVSRYISAIGKRAGVVVSKEDGKFASAHDLRRSFATRWAPRLKPVTLQKLMRHRSIETTLAYYVDQDSDEISAEVWAGSGLGTHSGTRGHFERFAEAVRGEQNP